LSGSVLAPNGPNTRPRHTTPETLTLYPYLKDSCLVYDDARTGLKGEAFVLGATEMLTRVVTSKALPNAERGFALTFAAKPFDGHDVKRRWLVGQHMEAWLCPALPRLDGAAGSSPRRLVW
jgi:hypothetical protein